MSSLAKKLRRSQRPKTPPTAMERGKSSHIEYEFSSFDEACDGLDVMVDKIISEGDVQHPLVAFVGTRDFVTFTTILTTKPFAKKLAPKLNDRTIIIRLAQEDPPDTLRVFWRSPRGTGTFRMETSQSIGGTDGAEKARLKMEQHNGR